MKRAAGKLAKNKKNFNKLLIFTSNLEKKTIIFTKRLQIFYMKSMQQISKLTNTFYRAYRKSWTLEAWSERLDSGHLNWTLELSMTGRLNFRRFDSGQLDSRPLDPGNSFPFLVISISYLYYSM